MANRFGVCGWYLALDGPSALVAAGRMGFEGIQLLDLGGSAQGYPLSDPRILEMYREAAATSGVTIHALQSSGMKRTGGLRFPLDSPEGLLAVENVTRCLDACQALSAPTFLVASFDNANFRNEYELDNTIAMLAHIVRLAADRGVTVAWEPFCSTDRLLTVLDGAGDELRLCYDTLNPIRFGTADPPTELRRIGADRIDHVHVKDAPRDLVGCWPLGEGVGKVAETMGVLHELGYAGWIMAENYVHLPPMNSLGEGWDLACGDLATLRAMDASWTGGDGRMAAGPSRAE